MININNSNKSKIRMISTKSGIVFYRVYEVTDDHGIIVEKIELIGAI